MQVLRTLAWIVITIILVSFIAINWTTVPVNIWPLQDSYLHFEWPVGVVALVFFLLGLVPMWLILRATRWRLKRRIDSLENSLRAAATIAPLEDQSAGAPSASVIDPPESPVEPEAPAPESQRNVP